jgi:head-tail adaptor
MGAFDRKNSVTKGRSIRKRRGRQSCEFQLKVAGADNSFGEPVDVWTTQYTVRGVLQTVDNREVFDEGERTELSSYSLSIRGNRVPTVDMRVVIDSLNYAIVSVTNPELPLRRETLVLLTRDID